MTVQELIEALGGVDPDAVVTLYDGRAYRHIVGPAMGDQFTVSFEIGRVVTEEDLA